VKKTPKKLSKRPSKHPAKKAATKKFRKGRRVPKLGDEALLTTHVQNRLRAAEQEIADLKINELSLREERLALKDRVRELEATNRAYADGAAAKDAHIAELEALLAKTSESVRTEGDADDDT